MFLPLQKRGWLCWLSAGGREHALCYALQRSPSCYAVFCAPGNAGISNSGDATCVPELDIFDSSTVISFCRQLGVGLVVVDQRLPLFQYQTFTVASAAKQYIKEQWAPIVIKADGLAAGKGFVVAMTLEDAYEAVESILVKGVFGSAGCHVIVEEFLEGEEASFFALVDGENAIHLGSAQDHKRVGDGDTGPNTGGMRAYSSTSPD